MAARTSLRDYQRELAARLQSAGAGQVVSKLGVQVGAEHWLVDLTDTGEVIPVPPVTPVPMTQPWFRGVANIRGNLCTVVDFSAFLGGSPVTPGEQARLLLFAARFRVGGALLVDRSLGLRNAEQLQAQAGAAGRTGWIRAEYDDAQGMHWKELDVPALVQHPDFLGAGA